MSNYIKTFRNDSPEYSALNRAAQIMTERSPRGYHYYVGDTFFDYGQNWVWTTILSDGGNWGGYQALCPRDQEAIIIAATPEALEAAIERIFADKYCPDKAA